VYPTQGSSNLVDIVEITPGFGRSFPLTSMIYFDISSGPGGSIIGRVGNDGGIRNSANGVSVRKRRSFLPAMINTCSKSRPSKSISGEWRASTDLVDVIGRSLLLAMIHGYGCAGPSRVIDGKWGATGDLVCVSFYGKG